MSDEAKEQQSPNLPVVVRNNVPAAVPSEPSERLGLAINVYVRRDGKDTGGRASSGNEVVVVGVCDYSDPTKEPKKDPLRPEFRFHLPSEERPAVWLVRGWQNKGGPYLVPERPGGGPDLSRALKWGGNFAYTTISVFWLAVGIEADDVHALRINDKVETISHAPSLDIA